MNYERNYNFATGTTIIADEIDEEFNDIRTVLNGNIEAENIKDASITVDKLDASLDPTVRTQETVGDLVVSGLTLGVVPTLAAGAWVNRDETIASGYAYLRGSRVTCAGGSKTFDASSTTWVLLDDSGNLHYEVSVSEPSVGYTSMVLYKVVTDGSKITSADPMGWQDIGTVQPFGGKVAPKGYLLCDGSEVSRSTYAKLYNVIQCFFGTPSGATVFKVPDMQGYVPVGKNSSTFATMAAAVGGETHSHTASSGTDSPDHVHNLLGYGATLGAGSTGWRFGSGGNQWGTGIASGATARHTHSISVSGSGTANSTIQPSRVLNYIIKAY